MDGTWFCVIFKIFMMSYIKRFSQNTLFFMVNLTVMLSVIALFLTVWMNECGGWIPCSMCCCSGVLEVCGVEFGCSIRCRWATVGVNRTCTTRKWLLWCSWYQKPKPSVNDLVFCDLMPIFVQRLYWCIHTRWDKGSCS